MVPEKFNRKQAQRNLRKRVFFYTFLLLILSMPIWLTDIVLTYFIDTRLFLFSIVVMILCTLLVALVVYGILKIIGRIWKAKDEKSHSQENTVYFFDKEGEKEDQRRFIPLHEERARKGPIVHLAVLGMFFIAFAVIKRVGSELDIWFATGSLSWPGIGLITIVAIGIIATFKIIMKSYSK